jgi:hypothetical protein
MISSDELGGATYMATWKEIFYLVADKETTGLGF